MQGPRSWLLSSLCLSLSACTGVLGGSQGGPSGMASGGANGGGGTTSTTAGSAGTTTSTSDCSTPHAPILHARLLTPSQYEHTVEDLLKVTDHPARDFAGGVAARLDEVEVERRANAAAAIASQAVANLAAWAPCMPTPDAAACELTLIDKLGSAAFRHPLADGERAGLKQLFDAGLSEKDFATGLEWMLTGLLQAPDFLYQLGRPAAGEAAGQVVPLADYELASRLALFVWDSSPDEALLTAAGAGKLKQADGLDAELSRLMADPRFARGTASFYRDWLGFEGFKEVARDDPGLTTEVLADLEDSLLKSATELYAAAAPNLQSLFTGQSYFLNDKLRTFYGLTGGNSALEAVELPGQGRRGILTHPGLMALLARPNASDPIARGLFVQRTLLCHEIPPPPQGIAIPPLAPLMSGLSTRARLEQHTKEPLCASCHNQIDPPGFALESYDAVGRYRTQDGGVTVDTSGTLTSGTDVDGAFASGSELFDRIAQSADVKRCFAQHYLTFAVARELADEDKCALSALGDGFASTGDLKQLIIAVAKSDAFRLRTSEALGAQP